MSKREEVRTIGFRYPEGKRKLLEALAKGSGETLSSYMVKVADAHLSDRGLLDEEET